VPTLSATGEIRAVPHADRLRRAGPGLAVEHRAVAAGVTFERLRQTQARFLLRAIGGRRALVPDFDFAGEGGTEAPPSGDEQRPAGHRAGALQQNSRTDRKSVV